MFKQDPPFCIQVEMTTGCSLQCSFCGINGFQSKVNNFKFMTLETAETLASQIADAKWNSRIEFAMHGEPSANPNWIGIIKTFRKYLPKSQIMMTSNGSGLVYDINHAVNSFFEAGGNILALDMYSHSKFAKVIMKDLDDFDLEVPVYQYPEQKEGNPHRRVKSNFLTLIADISKETDGVHASLQNHAGSASELDFSKTSKPCVKPFREIGVNSDGSVDVCCNDWLGELTIGNVNETSIVDIWHDDIMYAVRRMLMSRDRVCRPCYGCSDMGYRVGLLPDKKGLVKLAPFSKADEKLIQDKLDEGYSRQPIGKVSDRMDSLL